LRGPRGLLLGEGITALERHASVRTKRLTDGRERRGLYLVVPDDLGYVAGHDRKICPDFAPISARRSASPSIHSTCSPQRRHRARVSIAPDGSTPITRWPRLANSLGDRVDRIVNRD
jgi:hypothetical protein